jgi:hypothetical protein
MSLGLIIFFSIGITCLFYPKKIQEYALVLHTTGIWFPKSILEYIKTKTYLIMLRFTGILALIAFGLILFGSIKGYINK